MSLIILYRPIFSPACPQILQVLLKIKILNISAVLTVFNSCTESSNLLKALQAGTFLKKWSNCAQEV